MHLDLPRTSLMTLTAAMRPWAIACLVIALPLCGDASAVAALMGARHFHSNAAVAKAEVAVAVTDMRAPLKPARRPLFVHAATVTAAHPHAHAHNDLQRHHHEVVSPNTVFVDVSTSAGAARAELDESSSKASASFLTLFFLPQASWPNSAVALTSPWVEAPRWSLQSAQPLALRRPPKA
jgi:hypothetical protein